MDKNSKILILEDDAIRLAPNLQQYVSYYMSQLPSDWDILIKIRKILLLSNINFN